VNGRSLRSGFLCSRASHPDRPALIVSDRTLTFAEVDYRARQWAHGLLESCTHPPQRVGVFAYRSTESYIGQLAALYAGATFVPLNRKFPPARTRKMIQAAELDAIILDEASATQLAEVLVDIDKIPALLFPAGGAATSLTGTKVLDCAALSDLTPLRELPAVSPFQTGYLLFTSGSTGQPKGVPVTHANVLYFLDVMAQRYQITPEDRFSQTFDQTFDLSIFDVFLAWNGGACVCAMQPLDLIAPARFVANHGVTVWFSVPSLPALMRRKGTLVPGVFPTLRLSLFCGEPLPRQSAEAWQTAAPNSIVENLYGPTELTIACFAYRWHPQSSPQLCVNETVPIGRPYEGLAAIVVDEQLSPVPPGDDGELLVAGPQTVPGYWHDHRRTAERFVTLPYVEEPGLRFYRTGDRVRQLPNGDYAFLGRSDYQIKVLGYRVELGEIEAALCQDDAVTQAVALGWPIAEGTAESIVAFVCGYDVNTDRILTRVRGKLPDYMTPRHIYLLDEMPLNANGKIDRKALLERLTRMA